MSAAVNLYRLCVGPSHMYYNGKPSFKGTLFIGVMTEVFVLCTTIVCQPMLSLVVNPRPLFLYYTSEEYIRGIISELFASTQQTFYHAKWTKSIHLFQHLYIYIHVISIMPNLIKGIKNGCPCIVEIRGTQGCALVGDPARAVGECRDVAKAQP